MAGFWDGAASGASLGSAFGLPGTIIGGLFGGFTNTIFGISKKREENQVKLGELENQLEKYTADLEDLLEEGNQQINSETMARDDQATLASRLMPNQNKKVYEEVNNTRIQAEQAVATTTQQVASSGFRNTGSTGAAITQAERTAVDAVSSAKDTAKLSVLSGYAQLGMDYFNASNRIEAYRLALKNREESMNADIDYVQQGIWETKGELKQLTDEDFAMMDEDEKKRFHNKTGWEEFVDFFS